MSGARPAQPRGKALAQIHIAKAQLGMDEDTYRAMLWGVARVNSAAELDHAGRAKVLAHLQACGFVARGRGPAAPRRPAADRAALVAKIEALLAEAGRPWEYAHGMARRMFRVERVDFCTPDHLWRMVAALTYDQQRRRAREAAAASAPGAEAAS